MRFMPAWRASSFVETFAIAMHEHDQRLALLVFHHERLHHLALGHAERGRAVRRAAVVDVLELVLGVGDAVIREERGSRGVHGAMLSR